MSTERLDHLNADGSGSFRDRAQNAREEFATVERDGSDLAAFIYLWDNRSFKRRDANAEKSLSNAETLVGEWRFNEDDVLLHALPIFHTHGLFVATNTI